MPDKCTVTLLMMSLSVINRGWSSRIKGWDISGELGKSPLMLNLINKDESKVVKERQWVQW